MNLLTRYRLLWIISLAAIGLLSPIGSNYLLLPVAAQGEPTRVPTATPAPTWTPVPGATSTPTLMPGQTPAPTKTPSGREVDLRPSDDKIELDAAGQCVLFTWLVKGDIDRVEWDKKDDDTDPILVSASDERTECVDVNTEFSLIARWLNGDRTEEKRKVEIVGSDGSGSSSSGGSSSGGGPVPTPGAFVIVTPMLITNSLAFSPFDPNAESGVASAGSGARPEGILASIVELPETGSLATSGTEFNDWPQANPAPLPYQTTKTAITQNYVMFLFGICGLAILAKFHH